MVAEASDYSIYRRVVSQLMQGQEQLPSLPTLTLDIRRAGTLQRYFDELPSGKNE